MDFHQESVSLVRLVRDHDYLGGDRRITVLGHCDEVFSWLSGLAKFRNSFLRQGVRMHFVGCVLGISGKTLGAVASAGIDMELLRT